MSGARNQIEKILCLPTINWIRHKSGRFLTRYGNLSAEVRKSTVPSFKYIWVLEKRNGNVNAGSLDAGSANSVRLAMQDAEKALLKFSTVIEENS